MVISPDNPSDIDVSVVIPTFHREQLVLEAVRSVLSQPGVRVEVIVVDDAPGATARAAVEGMGDPRVQYFARPQPSGGRPARVRNDGAVHAKGRYIYFLDDDDHMEAHALAAMVQALDARPDAGMVFGIVTPFGEDPAKLQGHTEFFRRSAARASRMRNVQQLAATLVYCPPILINSACMARRSIFDKVGGFDDRIPVCEDVDLWARVALASNFVFVRMSVVQYRTGASSLMHNLVPNDPQLHESYQRIQAKYVSAVGVVPALFRKIWCRICLRA